MVRRAITIFGLGSALLVSAAGAQTTAAQPRVEAAAQPDNSFRLTVVGRTTAAVNYRPRAGDTEIDFAGTALLPGARGHATVSGEKGYIKIDARFDKLEAPTRFGREYLTYVLWAITPEGRATNLGEIQVDDEDARVRVTTELQSFGMIVTAFAQGDTPTLRPLLSDDVYDNFAAAIRSRQSSGESLETKVVNIRDADLIEARMDGRTAFVTIKFVSEQINVTRDSAGTIIDGDPDQPLEVVDIWTFARNTRSRNPNWTLIETRVPN